jgi:glycosyltransferase involved in cell wall biosynthesis/SAM-dependent methyltransferase
MDGALYEELIREREGNANRAYQQQEAFLTRFVLSEKERLGRPLRILEFGCGFGRHAGYLAGLEGVTYGGYDFSAKMMEPLRERPPLGLDPANLLVGPDVVEAAAGRRYDLVFTVSVLIHNPPEKVPELIAAMGQLLEPGGAICLVENQMVPVSVFENMWHQGCWLQSYTEHVRSGFDLHIAQGLIDTHDAYVLRPNGGAQTRHFRFQDGTPLSATELRAMSVAKLSAWAQLAQKAVAQGGSAAADTRLHEAEEMVRAERRRRKLKESLSTLTDDLFSIRAGSAKETTLSRRQGKAAPETAAEKPAALWDEPMDTRWAQADTRFGRVLHVFHQEWLGIRASAGYTPGHKLAVTAGRLLTPAEHAAIIQQIGNRLIRTVVFHGYSKTADELLQLIRRALGTGVQLYVVWLGNTSQFHLEFELAMFRNLLERKRHHVVDGIACVKPDMHLISRQIFQQTLLSLPPRVETQPREGALSGDAFIPVPNDWRKNFYSNLLAAHEVKRVKRVVVTTDFVPFPGDEGDRVLHVRSPGRNEVFRIMRESDVILNATLSECQPMTALEGLSLGTPCITGPLSLKDLDHHPYQQLTQVRGVDSVRELRDAIERILDLREKSPGELREMAADYSRTLCADALHRYAEFLQL